MAAPAAAGEAVTRDAVRDGFAELERQQQLLASCTRLYQQLTEHFGSLERRLSARSETLRSKRRVIDVRTSRALDSLRRRELSIDGSVSLALSRLDSLAESAARPGSPSDAVDVAEGLGSLCSSMDSAAFLGFLVARRKEVDALRAELPDALKRCVDPARFVMDAVSEVFPVDKRAVRSPTDLAWACVLILEAVAPAGEASVSSPSWPLASTTSGRGLHLLPFPSPAPPPSPIPLPRVLLVPLPLPLHERPPQPEPQPALLRRHIHSLPAFSTAAPLPPMASAEISNPEPAFS